MAGVYRGVAPAALGDGVSYAVRFATYARAEGALYALLVPGAAADEGIGGHEAHPAARLAAQCGAGAIAGVANWLVSYPLDTLAAQMMAQAARADTGTAAARDASSTAALRRVLREGGGQAALWRGLTPALLRAAPTNGLIFLTYEVCMQWLAAV